MHFITLDHDADFEGWRKAARALVSQRCEPVRRDVDGAGPHGGIIRPCRRNIVARSAAGYFQRLGQIRRTGAVRHPAPRRRTFRHSVSAAVAAAQPARSTGGRNRSRCFTDCGDGKGRTPRPAQDAGLCPLSRNRPRAEIALRRLVRAGTSHCRGHRAVLRAALCRHGLVDPDPGHLRALGRPCRRLYAGGEQSRSPLGRPLGRNLAALLRQHLQSGPAEGEGDAGRDAQEILAEPAGGFAY